MTRFFRSRSIFVLRVGILAGLFVANAQTNNQDPDGVTINGQAARLHVFAASPLAEALYQLSESFHLRIGFEEAELQYAGDMVDMTSPQYVSKGKNDRAYAPRGGPLDLQFLVSSWAGLPADPAALIRDLIAEHQARSVRDANGEGFGFGLCKTSEVFAFFQQGGAVRPGQGFEWRDD